MKMLKYSISNEENTFSPNHLQNNADTLMKETIDNTNPRSRTKMIMKKRARQKRVNDFALFPPISHTPQNNRKDVPTPYINGNELDTAYVNALGISRVHDVSTPYVMHSHVSKYEIGSPVPNKENFNLKKEYTRVSQGSHNNVIEVGKLKHERSQSHENLNKLGGTSPYIERRSRLEHHHPPHTRRSGVKRIERNNTMQEIDKNNKLQITSNQMGLVQRVERQRVKDNRLGKAEEPFSIRKKIEQFRKWHEEHYKDKLKKLKQEVDNQYEAEHRKLQKSRLGESPGETEISADKMGRNNEKRFLKRDKDLTLQNMSSSEQTPTVNGAEHMDAPTTSEATWHTWRDVDDSYAYNDVKQYIEENELMGKEKEDWIKQWIIDVETALQQPDNSDENAETSC